jgi:UDP-N-acetylglucosamine 4,6-dehydratase
MLNNKTIIITGGTGSFGRAFTEKILKLYPKINEIRIFSRDEKKQYDMRKDFSNKKIKFFIGDVRDLSSLEFAFVNVDFVFHAAALKQVPSCEFYPMEAVKTNVIGTQNVLTVSEKYGIKKIVCLSTDKAVNPINAMGISKAIMEKVVVSHSLHKKKTIACITRYGNVMGSRGSVIPNFIDQIKKNKPIAITDLSMTRFMMEMDDALDLVLFAFKHSKGGEIFVKKAKGASLKVLSKALEIIFKRKIKKVFLGFRHGEKKHETLMGIEEISKSINTKNYFIINPDIRSLDYDKYFEKGKKIKSNLLEYTSDNTEQLTPLNLAKKIKKLKI